MQHHSLILAKFQTAVDEAYCHWAISTNNLLNFAADFFCSGPKYIICHSTTFEAMGEIVLWANAGCVHEVKTKPGFHGWESLAGF